MILFLSCGRFKNLSFMLRSVLIVLFWLLHVRIFLQERQCLSRFIADQRQRSPPSRYGNNRSFCGGRTCVKSPSIVSGSSAATGSSRTAISGAESVIRIAGSTAFASGVLSSGSAVSSEAASGNAGCSCVGESASCCFCTVNVPQQERHLHRLSASALSPPCDCAICPARNASGVAGPNATSFGSMSCGTIGFPDG